MKRILFALVAATFMAGCSKPPPCETSSTGTLKVVSTQISPFYTYVNDSYYGISEPATITEFYEIPKGINTIDFINVNDYNDAYTATLNFTTCKSSVIDL